MGLSSHALAKCRGNNPAWKRGLPFSLHSFAHTARRGAGTIGISDLLVIVLIADAAQNAMASEYKSITEGLILVTTIVSWDYFLDWLGYKFPVIRPLLRPPTVSLDQGWADTER